MKHLTLLTSVSLLLVTLLLPGYTSAAEPAKQDIVGQWRLKGTNPDMPDMPPMEVIMTISKDKDGKLAGKWLSFFGPTDLKDVKFENDKLTFVQTGRFGGEEYTSDFSGTLKDGKLTGTLSGDRGDLDIQGAMIQPKPAVAGTWEIITKREDREMTSTLIIKAAKDGKLSGTWKSERGDSEISDVSFKDDKLTFKRKMTRQDQEVEINYELTVKDDALTGKSTSPRGEATLTGKRTASPAVGTWELTITSDRGDRKQILTIYPDMTAMYGADDLDTITVDGNKVSFKMTRTFGDRSFEMEFKGTVEGDKLTGEMTNSFSETPSKVTGTKEK